MYFGISVSRDRNIKTYPKNFVDIWFDIGTEHSTTNVLDVSEVLLSCSMRDRLLLLVLLVALMPCNFFLLTLFCVCTRPPWWWQWTGRSSSPALSRDSARDAGPCSQECRLTRWEYYFQFKYFYIV